MNTWEELELNVQGLFKNNYDSMVDVFSKFNTGRASAALLDIVKVPVYGKEMPLCSMGRIHVLNAQEMVIYPYDSNNTDAIIKGILLADLGVNVVKSVEGAKVVFPAISTEQRKKTVDKMKEVVEEYKISARSIRRQANGSLDKMKQKKFITEDDVVKYKKIIQDMLNKQLLAMEGLFAKTSDVILHG